MGRAGRVPQRRDVVALLAAVALVVTDGAGTAAGALRLTAEAAYEGGSPVVVVTATNTGPEVVRDVAPHLVYQRRTFEGEPARIDPGAVHPWRFVVPPPAGPGRFPAIIRVRHQQADGRATSTSIVGLIATPDAPETLLDVTLSVDPVSRLGNGRVLLDNHHAQPVAGRLSFVLDAGLTTDPESEPAEVPTHRSATVPLIVEDHGATRDADLLAYAVFEYTADGAHHTALGTTTVRVAEGDGRAGVPALVVGLAALIATLGVLAFALRTARARRLAA